MKRTPMLPEDLDDPSVDPVVVPVVLPQRDSVAPLIAVAAEGARLLHRLAVACDPAAEPYWYGLGATAAHTVAIAADMAAGLISRGRDPRPYFALAPYYLRGSQLPNLRILERSFPIVDDLSDKLDLSALSAVLVFLREVLLAREPGSGSNEFTPAREVMVEWTMGITARRAYALRDHGSIAAWLSAKEIVFNEYSKGKFRFAFWNMVGAQFEPTGKRVARRQDAWTTIREFLGLSDDVEIVNGWIPAGWKLAPQHKAAAMSTRKQVLTGTAEDVVLINSMKYAVRNRDEWFAIAHHSEVRPEGSLILKVTPDNFHEFKDAWHEDRRNRVPTFEQYQRYGLVKVASPDDLIYGHAVKWRKKP